MLARFESCVLYLVYIIARTKDILPGCLSLVRYSRHVRKDNGDLLSKVFGFVHILLFITWHFETASFTRKGERNILVHFRPCAPYGSWISFIREEE